MPRISLRISEQLLAELNKRANEANLTLTDFILWKTLPDYLEDTLTLEKIMANISKLPKGKTFALKDLFAEEAWVAFSRGSRISSGRLFYEAYKENKFSLKNKIEFLGKDSSNRAKYQKISS